MKRFSVQKILFMNDGTRPMKKCKTHIFEYNVDDMVWYCEDTDEIMYMEKPENGKKTYTLKTGYHARLLVKNL